MVHVLEFLKDFQKCPLIFSGVLNKIFGDFTHSPMIAEYSLVFLSVLLEHFFAKKKHSRVCFTLYAVADYHKQPRFGKTGLNALSVIPDYTVQSAQANQGRTLPLLYTFVIFRFKEVSSKRK